MARTVTERMQLSVLLQATELRLVSKATSVTSPAATAISSGALPRAVSATSTKSALPPPQDDASAFAPHVALPATTATTTTVDTLCAASVRCGFGVPVPAQVTRLETEPTNTSPNDEGEGDDEDEMDELMSSHLSAGSKPFHSQATRASCVPPSTDSILTMFGAQDREVVRAMHSRVVSGSLKGSTSLQLD